MLTPAVFAPRCMREHSDAITEASYHDIGRGAKQSGLIDLIRPWNQIAIVRIGTAAIFMFSISR